MLCEKCGEPVSEGIGSCQNCGAPLPTAPAAPAIPSASATPAVPPAPAAPTVPPASATPSVSTAPAAPVAYATPAIADSAAYTTSAAPPAPVVSSLSPAAFSSPSPAAFSSPSPAAFSSPPPAEFSSPSPVAAVPPAPQRLPATAAYTTPVAPPEPPPGYPPAYRPGHPPAQKRAYRKPVEKNPMSTVFFLISGVGLILLSVYGLVNNVQSLVVYISSGFSAFGPYLSRTLWIIVDLFTLATGVMAFIAIRQRIFDTTLIIASAVLLCTVIYGFISLFLSYPPMFIIDNLLFTNVLPKITEIAFVVLLFLGAFLWRNIKKAG